MASPLALWAILPSDVQRLTLSLSLDGLAALALTSHESSTRAAEALPRAIRWQDSWNDKGRQQAIRRAVFAVSTILHPVALTDVLCALHVRYAAEDHSDGADEDVFRDILQHAVATCIWRAEWTPALLLRLSELMSDPPDMAAYPCPWSIENSYVCERDVRHGGARPGTRSRRVPMAVEWRERALEDLSHDTYLLLGYNEVRDIAWPSALPPLGSITLRSRLHPCAFDALLSSVIHARVRGLSSVEAAWFVLIPFTGNEGLCERTRSRALQLPGFLTSLQLPTDIMVAVFERLALEERRDQEESGPHRCFHVTAAALRDWYFSRHAAVPLTLAERRQLATWFARECRHWLQDCLTMRYIVDWPDDPEDEFPHIGYYGPRHLPYGMGDLWVPAECKECRGCARCDGSEYAPRLRERRWVHGYWNETTQAEYLVAEQELRVLSLQLGLRMPGVDAQTQTDGEEGDAPYTPWHCWSVFHQERQLGR